MKVDEIFGPTIQGEGALAGAVTMFVRLGGCDYRCAWCPTPDTPMLMGDLTWKPAQALRPGDAIVGTERRTGVTLRGDIAPIESIGGYRTGRVLATAGHKAELLRVYFEGGENIDVASAHRFTHFKTHRFVAAFELEAGDRVRWFAVWKPASETLAYRTGYLAGAADGDGALHDATNGAGHFIATGDSAIMDRVARYLDALGIRCARGAHQSGTFAPPAPIAILRVCSREDRARLERMVREDWESGEWALGYLAGLYDTVGSTDGNAIRITRKQPHIGERAARVLQGLGLSPRFEGGAIRITGSRKEARQLLGKMRPALMHKVWPVMEGRGGHEEYLTVSRVEPLPMGTVISIKTDIGTYVAGGFISRNCDTMHAVDPANADKWQDMSACAVVEKLRELRPRPAKRESASTTHITDWVTISGGNPAIWQSELPTLVEALLGDAWRVNIETQGSVPNQAFHRASMVTISPKGPTSGMATDLNKLEQCIAQAGRRGVLKFVVGSREDYDYAHDVAGKHPSLPVYVQPLTEPDKTFRNYRWLCETVAADLRAAAWRVIPQLHVLAWGGERGR